MTVLELRNIRAGYGTIDVLHGVDLVAPARRGATRCSGPNGAGKSTTLAVCSGQIVPSAGRCCSTAARSTASRADALARAGVCLVPEGRGIFPNLTVTENLRMFTYAGVSFSTCRRGRSASSRGSKERRKQMAGTLSGGEQQMLAMARALATDPAVLLLDELSMGLAPLIVEELYGRSPASPTRACRS